MLKFIKCLLATGFYHLHGLANLVPLVQLVAKLVIASVLNFALSQVIFSRENIGSLYKAQEVLFKDYEGDKLRKMFGLWPPVHHPFLYLAHTTSVFLLLKMIKNEGETIKATKEQGIADDEVSTVQNLSLIHQSVKNVFLSFAVSLACFISICQPLRIAEMHSFIITINSLHMFLMNLIVVMVMLDTRNYSCLKMIQAVLCKIKKRH